MRAILREVSDAIAVYGVDPARARAQHAAYAEALGIETTVLPADPALPDGCFVEDTAVVDGARALICRLGFAARRPECDAIRAALRGFELVEMDPPATLEGGDVLRAGGRVYVGLSRRTNEGGAGALEDFLEREVVRIPIERCLHLKSAVTEAGEGVLFLNPARVDPAHFDGFEIVPRPDPNVVVIGGARIEADLSEFVKADGCATCLSLLVGEPS